MGEINLDSKITYLIKYLDKSFQLDAKETIALECEKEIDVQ